VVNHVSTARRVFTELQKLTSSAKVPIQDVVLLTARIRGYDRDRLMEHWLPEMDAKRPSHPSQHGIVWVVATQTIEVGADFDFDAMVTECAPLSALRQRFGRLNRLGRHRSAKGSIVPAMRAKGPYSEESLAHTWEWLRERSVSSVIDASSSSLSRALDEFPDQDLNDAVPDAPILLLPYLEAWAQTRPEPAFESEIAPFCMANEITKPTSMSSGGPT